MDQAFLYVHALYMTCNDYENYRDPSKTEWKVHTIHLRNEVKCIYFYLSELNNYLNVRNYSGYTLHYNCGSLFLSINMFIKQLSIILKHRNYYEF